MLMSTPAITDIRGLQAVPVFVQRPAFGVGAETSVEAEFRQSLELLLNRKLHVMTGDAFVVNAGGPLSRPGAWAWVPRWMRRWLPFLPARDAQTRTVRCSLSVVPAGA